MNKTEIIPIVYGKSVLPESMIFWGGAESKTLPIVFKIYLIRTESKLILADAGCVTMPGFDMEDFIGPVKALEKHGVSPDDITDVVVTHAHHDHIECVNCFKNAAIYIQRDEYEDGKGYTPDNANIILFDEIAEIAPGVKAVKIGGHSKGSSILEISADEKIYVIAGDECYKRECLDKIIPTGSSYCIEKSKNFVEKYSSDKYTVLLCHD